MFEQPDARRLLDDELLAVRCQLGEHAAFAELIARWHPSLLAYVRRQAGRDEIAADIVQDVWLRVLRGISGLRDGRRLRAWLFGIARRTWIDHLRSRYAMPAEEILDIDEVAAPEAAELDLDVAAMNEELERLPSIEREVLTLFHLHELSIDEVADVLGVPTGTVKSRLFRARRLMRRHLLSRGIEP